MPKPILNEETIADYMKRNKCGRDEAIELIQYDIAVENDEVTEYDLTPEQKKFVADMVRHTDHKKSGKRTIERKPNEFKMAIMAALKEYFEDEFECAYDGKTFIADNVVLTNVTRMLHFSCGDKEYDLQLIEKREPKEKIPGRGRT